MIDLLIIALVIFAVLFYVLRKPRPIVYTPVIEKPSIITDDSHLKAQLAALQSSFTAAQQELGQLHFKLRQSNEQLSSITAAKIAGDERMEKLQHQSKSSQVRTGFLAEAMLPLTEQFPCDPKTMRFLGSTLASGNRLNLRTKSLFSGRENLSMCSIT